MGANVRGAQTEFCVWAPNVHTLAIRLTRTDGTAVELPMQPREDGTYSLAADAKAGDRYCCVINGTWTVPDPVSRYLPEGVHGPSEIVDPHQFPWSDQQWRGLEFSDYILYELHIGTFTPEGTLDAAIAKLGYLRELGITAIELMPVNAFPGHHN